METIKNKEYWAGLGITFASLHPGLDPNDDASNNGNSNYLDYATGGEPTAPDDLTLRPQFNGTQLTFSYRTNATDVYVEFQQSPNLQPNFWEKMIEDTDYTINNTSTGNGRSIQTIDLLAPALNQPAFFFRQAFSTDKPVKPARQLRPTVECRVARNQLPVRLQDTIRTKHGTKRRI